MKQIVLTKGKSALVDDADYEWLSQWVWYYVAAGQSAARDVMVHKVRGRVQMDKLIMACPDDLSVNHLDRDNLNCQKANMRICQHKDCVRCQRIQCRPKSSQYKGVSFVTNPLAVHKWAAYIKVDQRKIHLGVFATEAEAAHAYNDAAVHYFGEFTLLNDL